MLHLCGHQFVKSYPPVGFLALAAHAILSWQHDAYNASMNYGIGRCLFLFKWLINIAVEHQTDWLVKHCIALWYAELCVSMLPVSCTFMVAGVNNVAFMFILSFFSYLSFHWVQQFAFLQLSWQDQHFCVYSCTLHVSLLLLRSCIQGSNVTLWA